MSSPEICIKCGFPLPDGRNCSFCHHDNMELKVEVMKRRMSKMQVECDAEVAKAHAERDVVLAENRRLRNRISDLLLLCEIEGRNPGAISSPIDPNQAS